MTLDNKLGLTDSLELGKREEKISKTRAKKLFEGQLLDDKAAGTYATLAFIHGFLFEEIYDFAGQIQTVNLSKGNVRFAPVMYLAASFENIDRLYMKGVDHSYYYEGYSLYKAEEL